MRLSDHQRAWLKDRRKYVSGFGSRHFRTMMALVNKGAITVRAVGYVSGRQTWEWKITKEGRKALRQ